MQKDLQIKKLKAENARLREKITTLEARLGELDNVSAPYENRFHGRE